MCYPPRGKSKKCKDSIFVNIAKRSLKRRLFLSFVGLADIYARFWEIPFLSQSHPAAERKDSAGAHWARLRSPSCHGPCTKRCGAFVLGALEYEVDMLTGIR